jgi:thiol:disulfide interchange protein DsbD
LKFLSNIDQVYGLQLLSREVYLAIWITIFVVMGFYLLGKIRLSHDSEVKHVSVGRLLIAMASFAFSIYLFTGLMGAPLKAVSSLIPPASVQNVANTGAVSVAPKHNEPECGPAKYGDKLHLPHGLAGYFDYNQGLACAKVQNKPVFLVFKGHACANCKKMENSVWAQPEALSILSNDYVVIALYTDDRTTLPEQEWATSPIDGKVLKTMGRVNLDLLVSKYNKNTIPYHVIIKPDGTEHELEVTFDNAIFNEFLKKGLQ